MDKSPPTVDTFSGQGLSNLQKEVANRLIDVRTIKSLKNTTAGELRLDPSMDRKYFSDAT